MARHKKSGKMIGGSHTTFIPLAYRVTEFLLKSKSTIRVTPGLITAGLRNVGGQRRIKVSVLSQNTLALAVRDNNSHQKMLLTSNSVDESISDMKAICKKIEVNIDIHHLQE